MDFVEINNFNQKVGEMKKNTRKYAKYICLAIILFILACETVGTIGAGERGVLLQFGAVQDQVFDEGLFFKIPFVQQVVKVDVKIKKEEVAVGAASKDLQMVTSKIALNYNLDPKAVNKIWQEVGADYNSRIIDPAIQESVKATTAKFTAEELITKREDVKEYVKNNLSERLARNSIIVDEFNIIDFDFSKSFNDAIEAKVTAEQLKLKAERDLERIKIEATQRVAEAEGKAKAIKTEAEALKANARIVELRWIEKWNGVTPQYWGTASPFFGLGSR